MQIFNVQIFGEDKDYWLSQTAEWKVEWIRNHTNQQNDAIIEEFINNIKISKDKICLTCGEKFQKIIQEDAKKLIKEFRSNINKKNTLENDLITNLTKAIPTKKIILLFKIEEEFKRKMFDELRKRGRG